MRARFSVSGGVPTATDEADGFPTNKKPQQMLGFCIGGEGGIRTLDTLLTYTHFPGVLLQPLGHLSKKLFRISDLVAHSRAQTLMVFQAVGNTHLHRNGKKF
tara:strand:+ start:43 stop:348 length:306 start_codon:yes stop_codon:yes gene_type:complete